MKMQPIMEEIFTSKDKTDKEYKKIKDHKRYTSDYLDPYHKERYKYEDYKFINVEFNDDSIQGHVDIYKQLISL